MRARRIEPDEYPQAHDALVRPSSTVGVETPDLAVARTDVPNAFAVGRRPAHATVVVTTGLLDLLDPEKLDAVLAHELAHVGNRDVGVMTPAYFLPSFAYLVAIGAYLVLVASSARWRASGTSTTWVPAMPVGPWLVRSVPEYCSATSPSGSASS